MFVDWRREVKFGCGIIGNFEKPRVHLTAFTVVSKEFCGAATVDSVRIETKNVGRSVASRH